MATVRKRSAQPAPGCVHDPQHAGHPGAGRGDGRELAQQPAVLPEQGANAGVELPGEPCSPRRG